MRIPSVYERRPTRADVAMTPMIDVVFLLLVFFLWAASFQSVEYLLPSGWAADRETKPSPTEQPGWEDLEQVVVRIHQDGPARWSLNGESIGDTGELRRRLERVSAIRSDLPVVIDPDDLVPLEEVIAVYDLARLADLTQIRFVARPVRSDRP